jgi:hypothetical protein
MVIDMKIRRQEEMKEVGIKEKIDKIENTTLKNLIIQFIKSIDIDNVSAHDKIILKDLNLSEDLLQLSAKPKSLHSGFHENLTHWQNIFDLEISKTNYLTLDNVKNIILSFISVATPQIELHGDCSKIPLPLKLSELQVYLEDDTFKEQLNIMAENNVSAFELLSNIIGNNNFQEGIDKSYFYEFDLSETQSLFQQIDEH